MGGWLSRGIGALGDPTAAVRCRLCMPGLADKRLPMSYHTLSVGSSPSLSPRGVPVRVTTASGYPARCTKREELPTHARHMRWGPDGFWLRGTDGYSTWGVHVSLRVGRDLTI